MKKLLLWTTVALIVIGGIVGVIGLVVAKLTKSPTQPLAVRPAIAGAGFSDGTRLDVLLHGEGSVTDGSMRPPSSSSFLKMHSSGRGTHSYGMTRFEVETATLNEAVSGIHYSSQGKGDLVLEVRFLDSLGDPVEVQRHVELGQIEFGYRSRAKSKGLDAGFLDAMTDPAATATDWPEYLVQLSDGTGGWILGDGPLPVPGDPEHRGALVFRGWPRTTNPLVFRALRPACPPVEFQLHRPTPTRVPPAWSASPLPQVHKDPDFTLTLTEVRGKTLPNFGHYLGLTHEFAPRFTENKREGFRGAKIACELVEVEGALGSRGIEHWNRSKDLRNAVPVPPDESLFRAHYRVERLNAFPQPQATAIMVAEAEIDATGRTINVISRTTGYSIKTIAIDNLRVEGSKDAFDIRIEGGWNDAKGKASAAPILGSRAELFPVVFLDGSPDSAGDGDFDSSGESSAFKSGSFNLEGDWYGHLKPGQKLKIGLATQLPPTDVFFIFDRSAVTE